MRPLATCCSALFALVLTPLLGHAQAPAMSDAQYIKMAEAGAAPAIGSKAAIARIDAKGNVTVIRPGTNGFTCVVGVPGDAASPFCADKEALTWITSAAAGLPKPTNSAPGIAYMAQGGNQLQVPGGESVMAPGPNTHMVKEPPHWMLMWNFDAAATGLPTKENPSGVYIMFAGTPYAHLMIYQNPLTMK